VIQAEGIDPDVPIPALNIESKENKFSFNESDFGRHIKNDESSSDAMQQNVDNSEAALKLAKEDYQLFSALMMLKGLHIVR
jgi:carboxyl-terminal processing protease